MSVTVVVPWPRYPVLTPGGKPSTAKNAGRLVPWLSANVVGDLAKFAHRSLVTKWREAAQEAAADLERHGGFHSFVYESRRSRVEVSVRLYKATGHVMDPFAISEGAKPLVDGLEAAGLILDDRLAFPGHMEALKAATRAECRVEIELRAVTP